VTTAEVSGLPDWTLERFSGAESDVLNEYRHLLWRIWSAELPLLGVVMLNPSVAGAEQDDPTIRVVKERARRAGYGGIVVGNLYAFIATDPRAMKERLKRGDAVGPANDETLERLGEYASAVWCAWGAHAEAQRASAVAAMLRLRGRQLLHVGLNADGSPRHPLRVPYSQPFEVYA